jgi:penicillin amidase
MPAMGVRAEPKTPTSTLQLRSRILSVHRQKYTAEIHPKPQSGLICHGQTATGPGARLWPSDLTRLRRLAAFCGGLNPCLEAVVEAFAGVQSSPHMPLLCRTVKNAMANIQLLGTVCEVRSISRLACALLLAVSVSNLSALAADRRTVEVETISVPNLHQPAEILIDHWGVPHIYAKDEADLFFVQGFNAARDRLFQIDLWRRRGLGQLAEAFGPSFVEQDKATRLFLYRGDMDQEWAAYGKDARQIAGSFVAGINAYIDWLEKHPEGMPFEFKAFNYTPARWVAEDVVRIRSHGLTGNLDAEVERARMACAGELKSDEFRLHLEPPWETRIPEGLDPCLPKDVLKKFDLATEAVRATPQSAIRAGAQNLILRSDSSSAEARAESNNWVVSAGKSATGRAIMANDPHREYLEPSIRYIVDLNSPTLHVTGIGEPAIPGISNGHNDWIAFGGTYFAIDQQDLYVYELNPDNSNEYKYKNRWEPFRVIREEIRVKGQTSLAEELKFTRHGPVIYVDAAKNRAFAARTLWLEPGMSPYMASLGYLQAKNFEEFKQALQMWGTPPINHVYADVEGNIGWAPMGFCPVRPNWDGLLPVPGDGRYEWAGQWSADELPRIYNPTSGYVTTSNEMNLPSDYPYKERKLGFEWSPPFRHQRIDEILSGHKRISIEDSMALQNDVVSIPARRLVTLLQSLRSDDAATAAALTLLKNWNANLDSDSPQATLEEVWFSRHLGPAFKEAVLSKTAGETFQLPDPEVMLDTLEHPETRFRDNAIKQRDQILLASLEAAYQEMQKLQGADSSQWKWGKLHFNLVEHPLSSIVDEQTRSRINVGPIPKNGSRYTVNASGYRTSDFRQTAGPSARLVIDVGDWDNSRAMNHPGQSGDPGNPHYRDLATLWRSGQYFPLLYSRKAVENATEKKIELVPQTARP